MLMRAKVKTFRCLNTPTSKSLKMLKFIFMLKKLNVTDSDKETLRRFEKSWSEGYDEWMSNDELRKEKEQKTKCLT